MTISIGDRGEIRIDLYDGKYTYIREADGSKQRALRYGEEWRSLVGDGFVLAMAQEIGELGERAEKAEKEADELQKTCGSLVRQNNRLRTYVATLEAALHKIAAQLNDGNVPQYGQHLTQEALLITVEEMQDIAKAALSAPPASTVSQAAADVLAEHPDTKRLDLIQGEYLMVDTFAMPTGGGDADVGWTIAQYYESEDKPRELVRFYVDDVRGAIDAAQRYFDHEPEPLNSPVDRLDRAAERED